MTAVLVEISDHNLAVVEVVTGLTANVAMIVGLSLSRAVSGWGTLICG